VRRCHLHPDAARLPLTYTVFFLGVSEAYTILIVWIVAKLPNSFFRGGHCDSSIHTNPGFHRTSYGDASGESLPTRERKMHIGER